MSTAGIAIDILRSVEQVEAFRPQWEQLYADTAASPYVCFDWFVTDMEYLASPDAVRVGVVRDAQGVLAIIPLEFARERFGPATGTILRFAGGGWAQRNTAVLADRAQGAVVVQQLLGRLWQSERHWAYCRLNKIPAGSPLLADQAGDDGGRARMRTLQSPTGKSIIVQLPKSWQEFRRGLSPAHRKNISRRINGMKRCCDPRLVRLGLDPAPDTQALAKLIQDALTVSRKSWQGSSPQGRAISNGVVAGFFAEASRRMARRGMLDLSVLYAGAVPVSFVWGPARPPNSNVAKLGFDPAFKAHSPGLVHLAMLISDSIDRGLARIDMGVDVFDYKSKWSKHRQDLFQLWCYPPGLMGGICRWWRRRRLKQTGAPTPPRAARKRPVGSNRDEMR